MRHQLIDVQEAKTTSTCHPDARVNAFIEQRSTEPLYYSRPWQDLIARVYGYSMVDLLATNPAGEITGYLPLSLAHSPLSGRRLVSLPFSDFCPLLTVDDASVSSLLDQAIHLAREKRVRYLELRSGSSEVLARCPELEQHNLYVRWLLPLRTDSAAMWSECRKSVRQMVRKSQKLGVEVRTARRREEMLHYYRLHLLTRSKKHGMPAQPLSFFMGLWDAFAASGSLKLMLAQYQGTTVAGMILLASGTTVRYAYSASDLRYLHLAPNHPLLWEGITWAGNQGYTTFDLGRTASDNQGLMFYKSGWGAVLQALPYYYFPSKMGLATTSESSLKYRLLTACWKRLPPSVAGPLGGFLYGHLG